MSTTFRLLLAAVVSLSPLNVIGGQAIAQSPENAVAKGITADFANTTVGDAIAEVARQAGMKLMYKTSNAALGARVNAKLEHVTVEDALAAITRGTTATARVARNRNLILVSSREVKAKVAQGVISGRVTDAKTSKPIAGASVSIGAVSDKGVTTGEDGSYRLTGVANGTHTVTVRLLGYAKQTRQVTVAEGATVSADFKLEPSASILDQVVVTGVIQATERKAIPNAITVVTAKDIEQKGITRIDQLFRGEIPGVFAIQTPGGTIDSPSGGEEARYGGAVMFVRGGTKIGASGQSLSIPIKTYVDGVELANPAFLTAIDPKSIERIEILTGPQASTIYGSGALGGVLQIFTKKGNSTAKPDITLILQSGIVENSVSNSYTPQHDYAAQVSGAEQGTSYAGGIGYSYLGRWTPGAYTRTYSGYGSVRRKEGVVTAEASARLSRRAMGNATTAAFSYRHALGASLGELVACPNCIMPLDYNPGLSTKTLGFVADVSARPWWQQRITVGTDEVSTNAIQLTGRFTNPTDTLLQVHRGSSRKLTAAYSTNLSGTFTSALAGTLTLGADYTGYSSDASSGTASTNIGSLTGGSFSISRADEKSRGYYAQSQLAIQEALFLTGGVRIEDNPKYGEDYGVNVAPRIGASFVHELGVASIKLRAAYGVATRAPDPTQRLGVIGTNPAYPTGYLEYFANPTLEPEIQRGGEGGIEIYLGNRVNLQITRYDQEVEKLILRVVTGDSVAPLSGSGVTTYFKQQQFQNVGTIRNRGWEGQGDVKLIGPLSLGGTWSYNRSRITQLEPGYRCTLLTQLGIAGLCYFIGGALQNVPEHTGVIRLTYSSDKSTVLLSMSHIGQRIFRDNEDIFMAGTRARLSVRSPVAAARQGNAPFNVPGYGTVDIRGTHTIGKFATLILSVINATNTYDGDLLGLRRYPVMGRQVMLGARLAM